ncbi:MAG: hypothetical protein UV38_C0006G0011 [candidate division TM6 bacterium GW2011_GWE2_42_60]|nr:MAG: hypothetical protein UV38_C0006G0011 [candidate division TM6 bacterium GW2011_GWE2_42_60]
MQLKNKIQRVILGTILVMLVGFQAQSVSAIGMGMVHTIDQVSLDKLEAIVQNGCDRISLIAKQNLCRAALLTSSVLFVYWGTRLIFEYLRPVPFYGRSNTDSGEQKREQSGAEQTSPISAPQQSAVSLNQEQITLLLNTFPSFYQRAAPYCVGVGSIGLGIGCFLAALRL